MAVARSAAGASALFTFMYPRIFYPTLRAAIEQKAKCFRALFENRRQVAQSHPG